MKIVYAVFDNADHTEGRGPMVLKALFDSKDDAETIRNRTDALFEEYLHKMGEVREVPLFESVQEFSDYQNGEARRKAIAKLTPEELAILKIS